MPESKEANGNKKVIEDEDEKDYVDLESGKLLPGAKPRQLRAMVDVAAGILYLIFFHSFFLT